MTNATGWFIIVASGVGCYLFKLAGYSIPVRWLARPRIQRVLELLPVALLSALIVVQAIASGRHYDVNGARLTGLAVGAIAVYRKATFIVVVVGAAVTAALVRLV